MRLSKGIPLGLIWLSLVVRPAGAAGPLGAAEKREAVQAIARIYREQYVYPDVAEKMASLILSREREGKYADLQDGKELARQLTIDLYSVCQDRHVTVAYVPERIARRKAMSADQLAAEDMQEARRRNFGFSEARVLEGRVGYLKMTYFDGSSEAFAAASSALSFLAHCDALILDVRYNPGGDAAMAQFLASYFLPGPAVLLDQFHYRQGGRVDQLWSLPYVPGRRLTQTDLYILIDRYTFSAAEGLAYDLQALKRAVVVGEPSVGGAHVTEDKTVLDCYLLFVPVGYSRNPVTGTNFEGKGVQPDFPAAGPTALDQAHLKALTQLQEKGPDAGRRQEQERARKAVQDRIAASPAPPLKKTE